MKRVLSLSLMLALAVMLSSCFYSVPQQTSATTATTSQPTNTEIDGLPATYAEWKMRADRLMKSPTGAVRAYFDGVYVYMNPATRVEGQKMLRYILREDADWDTKSSYNTFVSRMKDPNYHYIFRSFAQGSSPENNYKMNPDYYDLYVIKTTKESDHSKVYIRSSGSTTDRAVWVKQFPDGNWHVVNNANVYGNIKPPVKADSFDPNFK